MLQLRQVLVISKSILGLLVVVTDFDNEGASSNHLIVSGNTIEVVLLGNSHRVIVRLGQHGIAKDVFEEHLQASVDTMFQLHDI